MLLSFPDRVMLAIELLEIRMDGRDSDLLLASDIYDAAQMFCVVDTEAGDLSDYGRMVNELAALLGFEDGEWDDL